MSPDELDETVSDEKEVIGEIDEVDEELGNALEAVCFESIWREADLEYEYKIHHEGKMYIFTISCSLKKFKKDKDLGLNDEES